MTSGLNSPPSTTFGQVFVGEYAFFFYIIVGPISVVRTHKHSDNLQWTSTKFSIHVILEIWIQLKLKFSTKVFNWSLQVFNSSTEVQLKSSSLQFFNWSSIEVFKSSILQLKFNWSLQVFNSSTELQLKTSIELEYFNWIQLSNWTLLPL
jgi:hypothetical protein